MLCYEADAAMMASINVMDYSLLLAVFDAPPPAADAEAAAESAARGTLGVLPLAGGDGELLLVGVIDVLQTWTCKKGGEACLKTTVLCKDAAGISAVPAAAYQRRFCEFIGGDVFAPAGRAGAAE
jgi:hypothetical protein